MTSCALLCYDLVPTSTLVLRAENKMAAAQTCWKCFQNVGVNDALVIRRSFSCSSILSKKDIRPTTRRIKKPIVIKRPRDDLSFLYSKSGFRNFPFHTFSDAMKLLRACAHSDENVGINLQLNVRKDKVNIIKELGFVIFEALQLTS